MYRLDSDINLDSDSDRLLKESQKQSKLGENYKINFNPQLTSIQPSKSEPLNPTKPKERDPLFKISRNEDKSLLFKWESELSLKKTQSSFLPHQPHILKKPKEK